MTARIKFTGFPVSSTVTHQVQHGVETKQQTVPAWQTTYVPVSGDSVSARVSIFVPEDWENVTNVVITSQPDVGHVVAKDDNTIALIMSELEYNQTGAQVTFGYDLTGGTGDGPQVYDEVTVASSQEKGWGLAKEMYSLGLDGTFGEPVFEHGIPYVFGSTVNGSEGHRRVYVSGSPVFTEQAIVDAEGGEFTADDITGFWLAQQPQYAHTDTASIDEVSGEKLWRYLTEHKTSSHWLLLEKGYQYIALGSVLRGAARGESGRLPILVTSYGTGDLPEIRSSLNWSQDVKANVAMTNVKIRGITARQFTNLFIFGCGSIENPVAGQWDFDGDRQMIMRCDMSNAANEVGGTSGSPNDWNPKAHRISGAHHGDYLKYNTFRTSGSLFFVDCFCDHNGWTDGYDKAYRWYDPDTDTYWGQPPSQYSHDFYLQDDGPYVCLRRTFASRSSFTGIMQRQGGVAEDCVLFNNPVGISIQGGDYKSRGPKAYTCYMGSNLVHFGSERNVTEKDVNARKARGANTLGVDSTEIDLMITHMFDPADNDYLMLWGDSAHTYQDKGNNYYQSGRIINMWRATQPGGDLKGSDDEGVEGLIPADLLALTATKWLEAKVGGGRKTITDVAEYFKANMGDLATNQIELINFFRVGFNKQPLVLQTTAATYLFDPKDYTEGMRWDMRENWSPAIVPGVASTGTDSVNLMGAKVLSPYETLDLATVTFGAYGQLHINGGKITAATLVPEGTSNVLALRGAGELSLPSGHTSANEMTVNMSEDARIYSPAAISGALDINLSGRAQLVIQGGGTLTQNGDITIDGPDVRLGADDTAGVAALVFTAGNTLNITNLATIPATKVPISKFRSGMTMEAAQNVTFNVTLAGTLDLTGATNGTYQLIAADSITGSFGTVLGGTVSSQTGTTLSVQVTSVATVPAPPTDVVAFQGNSESDLDWLPSTDNGREPITTQEVWRNSDGGAFAQIATIGATDNTYNDPTALNGTSHTYTIVAVNSEGPSPQSVPSNAVIPITEPGPPSNLAAISGGPTLVNLSWDLATYDGGQPEGVLSQTIQRSAPSSGGWRNSFQTVLASATTYADTAIEPGTHMYRIVAVNSAGQSVASNEVTIEM